MKTLKTIISILFLLCWLGAKAQIAVSVASEVNDRNIKKDEKTGKLALYTSEGKRLLNDLDSIKRIQSSLFIVTKNKLKGVYSSKGKEVIPMKYNRMEAFGNFFWKVFLNGKQGIYTFDGKKVLPTKYEEIIYLYRDWNLDPDFVVKEKGKYGMFNAKGECMIQPEYDEVKYADQHQIFIKGNEKGYLMKHKQTLIKGITIKDKITNWIKQNGDSRSINYFIFEDKNGKNGLLDIEGNVLVSPQYESMAPYYNISSGTTDYLVVQHNSLYGVISLSNEVITPLKYKSYSNIYIRDHITLEDEEGYMLYSLKDNSIFHSLHFDHIRESSGPYALIKKEGKAAFLNKVTLELVFPFKYEDISESTEDSLFTVSLNGKYGLVDKTDKVFIPCIYDEPLYPSCGNKFVVKKDYQYGIVNLKNEIIYGMIPHPIIAYSDSFQIMDISRNNPELDCNLKEIKRE
ncbi:WG repeat-containing protein [Prevotella aurantiaca]|uniref:WG repeat-containing protein n=1 Tax=Prevotella aurantiaca TaxID=596085 RepID=UPI0028DC8DD4|nr:WG repeat-containing protein [Prevotella aurantiaca]